MTKKFNFWGLSISSGQSHIGPAHASEDIRNYFSVLNKIGIEFIEYSLTGNIHGMPLSILLNLNGVAGRHFPWIKNYLLPQNLIYIGIRDIDPFEHKILQELKIKYYSARDVKKYGMISVASEIYGICQNHPLHISFDIDSISPEFAPATGLLVPNGLNPFDLEILGETFSRHQQISSMDIVEINPFIGNDEDVFKTNIAAINFVRSIFCQGRTINYGGFYDDNRRANKARYSAQMESCS